MRKEMDREEFLYEVSEESILRDWNSKSESEGHEFSQEYKAFREELIKAAAKEERTKKKRFFRMPAGIAAALAAVVVLSAGAYAISGFFDIQSKEYTNESRGEFTYTFEAQDGVQVQPVKIIPDYLPEGYKEEHGKYHAADGSGGLTIANSNYSNEQTFPYVSDVREMEIGGVSADLITRNGPEYSHILLLFHQESGNVITIYGHKDLPEEEIIKVAENLRIEPTGEEAYTAFADRGDKGEEVVYNVPVIKEENVVPLGEAIPYGPEFDNQLSLKVEDIQILDRLPDGEREYFFGVYGADADVFGSIVNEDGTLKEVELGQEIWENQALVEKSEGTVPMKFVYVTLEVTNPTAEDALDQFLSTKILWKNSDTGEIEIVQALGERVCWSDEAAYYDGADYLDGEYNNHAFFSDFKAGETRTVHIGVFCPEIRMDEAYLVFNDWDDMMEASYVKLIP